MFAPYHRRKTQTRSKSLRLFRHHNHRHRRRLLRPTSNDSTFLNLQTPNFNFILRLISLRSKLEASPSQLLRRRRMGCFASKSADSKSSRLSRWRATGIVALRDGKLKSFPDEVLELEKSVRTLDLTHNKLVEIPEEISKLKNMQRLILANNILERLPMNIGKLQALKFIILDGNRLTTLPDEVGQLVRLERLSISGNLLTRLPETIGSLRNLLLLNVSNNKLKSLPESMGSCFSLEELQANENSIEELPTSVCSLIHLKSLCLDHNNLKQIPPNLLKECKTLQNFSLHGNPISMDQFQQMEGFQEFEDRRKKKFDKQIDSNVMISSKGLDEGVDL